MRNIKIANHYLDASAAVKLIVPEMGGEQLKKYFDSHNTYYMTSISFAETLSTFKLKWCRKELSHQQYLFSCRYLFSYLRTEIIQIDEVPLQNLRIFNEVEAIAEKYDLDVSDALQIFTVKHGKWANFTDDSQTIFITADKRLQQAACAEGVRVWNCEQEKQPKQ